MLPLFVGVKVITFTTVMTASEVKNAGRPATWRLLKAFAECSAAGEGWQHLYHGTLIEYDRLLSRPAYWIGVHQER